MLRTLLLRYMLFFAYLTSSEFW